MDKTMRKRQRPFYGSGIVSENPADLSELFTDLLYACKRLHLTREERKQVRKIDASRVEDNIPQSELDAILESDIAELETILESHARPYFYFSSFKTERNCDGLGFDYGYMLGELYNSDALRVADTSEVPRRYTGEVLYVNDHGNMTLYACSRGRMREVWAVV